MGCSGSNILPKGSSTNLAIKETQKEEEVNEEISPKRTLKTHHKSSMFLTYKFEVPALTYSNLLLYTNFLHVNSEFHSIIDKSKEKSEKITFKSSNHGIAVGYKKGYKLEFVNQDKFFVILDNHFEAYCIIDGHGPFGNKVAQIAQDIIVKFVIELNRDKFENEYDKLFNQLFENVNQYIISREEQDYGNYDPFLSGVAVTLVIRVFNFIYCANVGNVLAVIFNTDKLMRSKYFISDLSFNDSNFSEEILNPQLNKNDNKSTNNTNSNNNNLSENYVIENLIDPNEINLEIRRIYEHGGELRKLQGESKSRIFVKGKYFPGLINTRSLGDQIGKGIGVISTPHITKTKLHKENTYYLLTCSDGISNVVTIEKLIQLFHANDACKLFLFNI